MSVESKCSNPNKREPKNHLDTSLSQRNRLPQQAKTMQDRVFLQKLYPSPDAVVKGAPNIDIVLIHGVNGDPIKTWEHVNPANDQDPILWPRDLLPEKFPRARVLSFGYNADIYRNNSIAGIRDLGKTLLSYLTIERKDVEPSRPILFVPHCLGGIIVKQALHTAHYERDYNRIAKETKGIFFFGTPHLANSEDNWDHLAKAYSSLDKSSGWFRRSRLVKALQKDSDDLVDLMNKFRHMMVKDNRGIDQRGKTSMRWTIVNFYETVEYPGAKACVVDATAALLGVTGEIQKPVHRDHVGMCQFATTEDKTFQELCVEITKLIPEEIPATRNVTQKHGRPEVKVQLNATDKSGRMMQIEGKLTEVSYTVRDGSSRYDAGGTQSGGYALEENVRQGYLLEDKKPVLSDILGPRVVKRAETVRR